MRYAGIISKLVKNTSRTTTNKLRILTGNHQLLRCDFEDSEKFDLIAESDLLNSLEKHQFIIFSDYNKGTLAELSELLERCEKNRIFTIVDPKSENITKYRNCSFLKPNLKEFKTLFQCDLSNTKKICNILKANNIKNLCVTMGPLGVRHLTNNGDVRNYEVPGTEVFDVTGAGDTFTAALIYGKIKGYGDSTSIMLANLCARAVVKKVGTSTITEKEACEFLLELNEKH